MDEIIRFIDISLKAGYSNEDISHELEDMGFEKKKIEIALKKINSILVNPYNISSNYDEVVDMVIELLEH
jgi:uncharacterized protein Smg (DUF494 family)